MFLPEPVILAMGGSEGSAQLFTLAMSITAGGLLVVLARRIKFPAIVLLLIGGVVLGPEVTGVVNPEVLGGFLSVIVSLAIGIILFEGSLTLNVDGYRDSGAMIRRLLSLGVVITWLVTALFIYLLFDFDFTFCLLAASLVIVTGPTVIQPILKRIRLRWKLHHILHWEGVLIDPIGVFIAILCFELVVEGGGIGAFENLGLRLLIGLCIGYVGGLAIWWLLIKKVVPEEMINVFMVASAVCIFGLTEYWVSEGGLLSVTVAGLVVGSRKPVGIKSIIEFKATLTDLLIGMLFILLTSRLEFDQFAEFGPEGFILVGLVMLVVRPLTILASSWKLGFDWKEIVFLGWVGPRGVVAASMSSLFALSLVERGGFDNPEFLETFVYSVIVSTVVLQGFSAGWVAALLGLQQKPPAGWLVVGAHPLARKLAGFMRERAKVPVLLVDGNRKLVAEARAEKLPALYGDARDVRAIETRPEFEGIGHLLAFTDNEDLNELLCTRWSESFGAERVHRWASGLAETSGRRTESTGQSVWSQLPKPSVIGSEMMLGEAVVLNVERKAYPGGEGFTPLALASGETILLDPDAEARKAANAQSVWVLALQRQADYLLAALQGGPMVKSTAKDKRSLFAEMLGLLDPITPDLDTADLLDELLEREDAYPTSLGHGVAVPHSHAPHLSRSFCAVARLDPGLDFEAADEEPVRLVFLLLSPVEEPEMHLAVLGEIARLCADVATREELLELTEVSRLYEIIREHRRVHTAFAPPS